MAVAPCSARLPSVLRCDALVVVKRGTACKRTSVQSGRWASLAGTRLGIAPWWAAQLEVGQGVAPSAGTGRPRTS